jgi:hypothetical protein
MPPLSLHAVLILAFVGVASAQRSRDMSSTCPISLRRAGAVRTVLKLICSKFEVLDGVPSIRDDFRMFSTW